MSEPTGRVIKCVYPCKETTPSPPRHKPHRRRHLPPIDPRRKYITLASGKSVLAGWELYKRLVKLPIKERRLTHEDYVSLSHPKRMWPRKRKRKQPSNKNQVKA